MPYFSNCTLMGHITADIEVKQSGETTYCKFSLAVDTRYKKKDGAWDKRTTFWRCTIFGKEGTWLARDAVKGSLVLVSGEPYSEDYEKDGVKKQSPHHVRCNTAKCLDARSKGDAEATSAPEAGHRVVKKAAVPASDDFDPPAPF